MSEHTVFHIDVNSAFLSWTAADQIKRIENCIDLRTIPSVIGGDEKKRHGVVLAKSIASKRYGIHTGESLACARNKCPALVITAPDYDLYVRSSKALIKIIERYTDNIYQYSIDEAFADVTGSKQLCENPILSANELRKTIYRELGFTVNIGVSSNKFLAKMASDFEKPDKVHSLFPSEIETKMYPLSVENMFFVGASSKNKLNALGIHTIGDLALMDKGILISHFGRYGDTIWNFSHGIDNSLAFRTHEDRKAYGNSTTVSSDILNSNDANPVILSLCETICARLRSDGVEIDTIEVSIVNSDFNCYSHRRKLNSTTATTIEVYSVAKKLFNAMWRSEPIRQLGVQTSGVTKDFSYQYNIFDMDKYDKFSKLDKAIDTIREKYGDSSVIRASFIDKSDDHTSISLSKSRHHI